LVIILKLPVFKTLADFRIRMQLKQRDYTIQITQK
jgi:hypothetical protein